MAAVALFPWLEARAVGFTPLSPDKGYSNEKTQSVENAPPGLVGRKTTDRTHRVGNTEETDGNEMDIVLTIGGFARQCPSAEGIVEGTFEYSLVYDEINTDDGDTQRNHHARHFLAQLEGRVRDDGTLEQVILKGEYTIEESGTRFPPERVTRPVWTTFRPGPSGEPDMKAMESVVRMSADVATASVVLLAGPLYREAELKWRDAATGCARVSFDPPSGTRWLAPGESVRVRAELRSQDGDTRVPWQAPAIDALSGAGTVTPKSAEGKVDEPVTIQYTASSQPRTGHGFRIFAISRAGAAVAEWQIRESDDYELQLESTVVTRRRVESVQSKATATIALKGSDGISKRDGKPHRIYQGSGPISFVTGPLPGRDPCSPLISGNGTAPLTVVEALIDVSTERDASGAPTGGLAEIDIAYSIGLGEGETFNEPMVVQLRCVPRAESEPYSFWVESYLASRTDDGLFNFLGKQGWTYVGRDGVIATKTLHGTCGGLCDQETSVFTLRRKERPAGPNP